MFSFLIITGIVALTTAVDGKDSVNIPAPNSYINQDIFTQIKTKAKTWTPIEPIKNPFSSWSDADLRKMLGGLKTHEGGLLSKLLSFRMPTLKKATHNHKED